MCSSFGRAGAKWNVDHFSVEERLLVKGSLTDALAFAAAAAETQELASAPELEHCSPVTQTATFRKGV